MVTDTRNHIGRNDTRVLWATLAAIIILAAVAYGVYAAYQHRTGNGVYSTTPSASSTNPTPTVTKNQ